MADEPPRLGDLYGAVYVTVRAAEDFLRAQGGGRRPEVLEEHRRELTRGLVAARAAGEVPGLWRARVGDVELEADVVDDGGGLLIVRTVRAR